MRFARLFRSSPRRLRRFGRRPPAASLTPLDRSARSQQLPRQFVVRQTATDDPSQGTSEPTEVLPRTLVEAVRLFVQIPEQVERLDADVGAAETSLQQRPEGSPCRFVCTFPSTYWTAWVMTSWA